MIDLGFDVLNARMTVTYNDEQISPDAIVAAVAETGMSAVPWGERALEAASFWDLHGRTVMAAASGLCILAGFVAHWVASGSLRAGDILPRADAAGGGVALRARRGGGRVVRACRGR